MTDWLPSLPHQRGIDRFVARVRDLVSRKLLTDLQADVVRRHLMRLAAREQNPANTGNLEDLFSHTLVDTQDPIRAFAQVLADSIKSIPIDGSARLVPPIRRVSDGAVFHTVRDLVGYTAADKMLITHTMVAYADGEVLGMAAEFVASTHPKYTGARVDREVAKMAVQSQHAPSSTFVLARMHGLTLDVHSIYERAGYRDEDIAHAQSFYDLCALFMPRWADAFLDGDEPDQPEWREWRAEYLAARKKLPPELVYQLCSDTLTNFLDGTLESGKWTDASILFGGVTSADDIPRALARVVNQYVREHVALHGRPASELVQAVEAPLRPWGVGFVNGRASVLPEGPQKKAEMEAQFRAAWIRKQTSEE